MDTVQDPAVAGLKEWIGRAKSLDDEVTLPAVRRIAAMLDMPVDSFAQGDALPPHWYAMFFPEIAPQSGLGEDGHPRKGDFLPPVPLPRRMFAGRRARFAGTLRVGDRATKRSEIAAITPKTGRSGRMVFVTIRHTISVDGNAVITEDQDVVYREAAAPGAAAGGGALTPAPEGAAWSEAVVPDPVLLFRYSAITFNGHRIHYDADYVRGTEGYPGLVVNGGLTVLLLLEAARRRLGRELAGFSARNVRPLFVGRPVTLAGAAAAGPEGRVAAWAADADGALATQVELEPAA